MPTGLCVPVDFQAFTTVRVSQFEQAINDLPPPTDTIVVTSGC